MKKIKDHIDTWNWDVQCWGESNVVQHKMMEKNVCEQCMHTPINVAIKAKPLKHKMQALHSSPLMQQIPANFMQVPASNYHLGYPYGNTRAHNNRHQHHHGKRASVNDMSEHMEQFFKEEYKSKISNLTCVLRSTGVIG